MIELLLNAENALALGLLDQAERIYRTVLEADPRNGIAAVGLSRVALERGDEAGAHALALAALEIDPENATARRMIDRLEEVARYRDAAALDRGTGTAAPPDASAAAATGPDVGAAPQAVIPAFAAAEAAGDLVNDPVGVPVAPGEAGSELGEASAAAVAPGPGGSEAEPGGSAAGPMHESWPGRRGSEPEGAPSAGQGPRPEPAPPTAAAHQAAPARHGLLRRILRRS